MSLNRALRQVRAPDEEAAEARAWAVLRSAYRAREPVVQPRSRRSVAVAFAATLTVAAVALSPAGATVGRLITHALGVQHAAPTLSSLPAPGRLLISDRAGTWTVAANGSARRLGSWPQASWSPHGRYLAIANGNQLAAIDPHGVTQWTLSRQAVIDPRWYSPSGYRIAYLSTDQVRVVAGDGTGDHLVAVSAANVAPAWRPDHPYQLTYVTRHGQLVVRDADAGRILWSTPEAPDVTRLEWSGDGRYLLALSPTSARLFTASGGVVSKTVFAAGEFALDGALSPDGSLLALVLGGRTDEVVLARLASPHSSPQRVLTGAGLRQVLWSPDGRWLLVSWPAADQLVFVRTTGAKRIAAVSHIAQQFGQSGQFPVLEGWCCIAHRH